MIETPGTSIEAAKRHHAEHGDMDGDTCLLSQCALHYPSPGAQAPAIQRLREVADYLASLQPYSILNRAYILMSPADADALVEKLSAALAALPSQSEAAMHALAALWEWATEQRTHLESDPVPDGLGQQVIAALAALPSSTPQDRYCGVYSPAIERELSLNYTSPSQRCQCGAALPSSGGMDWGGEDGVTLRPCSTEKGHFFLDPELTERCQCGEVAAPKLPTVILPSSGGEQEQKDTRGDEGQPQAHSPTGSTASAAGAGWQPIETAPSRRKVLVTWVNELGKRRTSLACYFDAGQLDMDDDVSENAVDEDGKNVHGGWFEDRECGDPAFYEMNEPLTHWMPLPAPPGAQHAVAKADAPARAAVAHDSSPVSSSGAGAQAQEQTTEKIGRDDRQGPLDGSCHRRDEGR